MSRRVCAAGGRIARERSRRAARMQRARRAELLADVAYVLEEAHAVLAMMPDYVVRTPTGPTTVKDIAGHLARVLRRLASRR